MDMVMDVVPFMIEEVDAVAEEVEELVEGFGGAVVGEDVLLGDLPRSLV